MLSGLSEQFEAPSSVSTTPAAPPLRLAEANTGRDYTVYSRAMDAAEDAKALDIFPYMRVPEGGVILDLGAGTAALSERAARYFSRSHVIAQDVSHELLEIADHRRALINIVFGNALDRVFPENSLDSAMCSSCGHEIESFCGPGSMHKVLDILYSELKPGGSFVHRDFIKPTLKGDVYLEICDSDVTEARFTDAVSAEEVDYSKLSTAQLFFRFHKEYGGGNAFSFELEQVEGKTLIKLPAEWAYEFYMRKDYVANWRNEIKEKYSYWDVEQAQRAFQAAGFVNIQVIPHRNQWLYDNRFEGKIALYSRTADGLIRLPFFDTHMTVVGHKPGVSEASPSFAELPLVNYDRILDQIKVETGQGFAEVGDRHFELASDKVLLGSKRQVYYLAGEPKNVLKLPRTDGLNVHNCFKAMQQSIAHEDVLESHQVPHLKILDYDKAGPPYRFLVQEALPADAECAADLIMQGRLTEADIATLAGIVNRFELEKRWQLDTNPFNWYRVTKPDGGSELVYADGKVYRYDEKWAFSRVGLLQWIDPGYVKNARERCAVVPEASAAEHPSTWWKMGDDEPRLWAKYLHPSLHPRVVD